MIAYLRQISELLRGSRAAVSTAFFLSALSAIVDMVCMALLPAFLFSTLSAAGTLDSRIPVLSLIEQFLPTYRALTVAVISAFLCRGVLSLYVNGRISRLSERIRATLVHRLVQHYLTCSYQQFTRRSVASALTMAGSYAATFAGSVALPLLRLVLDMLTLLAILGFLLALDFRIVGVISVALAAVALAYYYSVRRVTERQALRLAQLQESLSQQMSRALHSPREVRVFQLQSHFIGGIGDALARSAEAQARLVIIGSLPRVLGELTLIGLALSYLAYRTHSGTGSTLLVSQLGLLGFAGLRLLPTFAQILNNVAALRAGRHATGLLVEEIRAGLRPASTRAGISGSPPPFESLELRDVSFAYAEKKPPVLDRISLTIQRGQSIGVVGASGAGKSTLGDVLLGLLEPTGGETRVNGVPASLASEAWWHTVGFVPQAVFLSNDSLLRNIAFGVPDRLLDRAKVERAATMAQLDDVIRGLPQGLDTPIGDYGVRLSGGQRQRVAIARALYHDRQFLVLDEATSALDTETEKAIVAAISSLRGTVTTFIIAHRHSTLESCDTIIELSEGRVQPAERLRAGST